MALELQDLSTNINTLIRSADALPSLPSNDYDENDIFVDTSTNTIYRIDISGSDKVWVSIGGGGGSGSGSGGSGSGGSGSGISQYDVAPDVSLNEGNIYYDTSSNIFYEASQDKTDVSNNGALDWRPLGYSFFRENLEGQPPAPYFFFFDITPSSIVLRWTNPRQYPSGVTNTNDSYLNENSATVNALGNIYFPVVNRLMMQIKNRDTNNYMQWGTKQSPISKDVSGLEHGYVVSSKNYPIPPMATGTDPSFGTTLDVSGRETAIYTLEEFPTSIILYSAGNTPENSDMSYDISNNTKRVFPNKVDANITELSVSDSSGYEIKLWLENQYNSGTMTERDFNVTTLIKDNDNNSINFLKVDEPSQPLQCNFKLAFNDMTTNKVETGSSVIELEVVDPSRTTINGTGDEYNSIINLRAIRFEYANTATSTVNEADWTPVKKMYFDGTNDTKTPITSVSGLSVPNKNTLDASGIFSINRKNDNDTVNNKRYYYIKLNDEFLDVSNNDMHEYHSFRVRYQNASNVNFSPNKESNQISIREPVKPTIASVRMTESNKVTITLSSLNEDNVVYDVCSNILVNNQYSVYSRHLDLKAEYELDDGSIITTYKPMGSKDYSYDGLQNTNTTYVFDIPDGLGSGTDDISASQSYKWQFQFRVKNNVRNVWSAISDAAIDNNSITESSANAFEIVPVSTQNVLTNINFNSNQNERDDGKLHLSWDHPVSGNRGVVSGKLNDNYDPTIYDYEVSIFRNDVTTNQIVDTFTNTQSNRTTDAVNEKIHDNILTIIDKNGVSSNSSGSGYTNGNEKEIKVLVKQRNEYVTNQTDVSASMFYTLGKPKPPTQHTLTNSIKTSGNNTITFKWNKNDNTGFSTRELSDGTLENSLTNKVISINRYRVIIQADRVNSKSPYYRLDRISYEDTPTLSNINISNSVSRDANLYLQASDGIIDKNDVYTDTTGNSVSNINHVLVYPETTYTFSVYPRNRFFLESDNSLNVTITTSYPSANISQLTNGTIPLNSSYNDLKDDFSYAQKGFLLESSINTPPSNYVLYQITKAYNSNLNNIGANITHRINKNKFNDFLVDNDTNTNPNEYISETSHLDNKKLRQFRIYNVGESPSALLYVYGSDSTFADISSNNTSGTSMEDMISISASNIKDEYSVTGKDPFNQGYWWQENMSYTISIDDSKSNLYKNPVKLEFHTRYNNQLDSSLNFNNSSLEIDGDVVDVSRIILQNSENTNQVVYFDELNSNPTASKIDQNTDMIQISNFTNKINGVPNLYRISNSYGYDMTLNYKLENYSKYYGLNPSVNFVSHTFTTISKSGVAPRKWSSKSQCTRTISGWTITNLPINETTNSPNSLGSHSSSTTSDVQIQLNMKNMYGTSDYIIGSNDSTIHKFIYDKTSVDLINELIQASESSNQPSGATNEAGNGQIMQVPTNFDPFDITITNGTQGTDFTSNVFDTFDTYNDKQLILYNGKFSSSKYLSQNENTFYNALVSNKSHYGITDTFKTNTNTSYSWVIYKFQRVNKRTSAQSIKEFVISFYNNTNITDTNIENGDAVIFIQVQRKNGSTTTTNSYQPTGDDGATSGLRYKWIRYKSSGGVEVTAVANDQINNPVSFNVGLGSMKGDFDNTGFPSYIGPNSSGTIYHSNSKNLSGVFFTASEIGTSEELIFYIAVGIKNDKNLYISKIKSFDLFYSSKDIVRQEDS